MTQRKPSGLGFESWIDRQIRDAEKRGEFDGLPGEGKPIPDLDDPYDENWWLKKFLKREGLSLLPDSLELRRTIERELQRIARLSSERRVRREAARLNETIARVNASAPRGPASTTPLLDVEEVVRRWNSERSTR